LCALLMLALCCCPSVCATDTELDPKSGAGGKAMKPTYPAPEKPGQGMELPGRAFPSPEKITVEGTESVENTALLTSQTTGTIKDTSEPQSNLNKTKEKDDGKSTEERT
ncbi:putative mucin TcMUCII, partial [Trypanosoma cruzi]